MAIFSPKLPTLAPHSHAKTHLGFRPSYVPLTPIKKLEFPLVMSADSVSGVAATAPEALTSDEGSLGSNGSPPPSVAAVEELVVAEAVSGFQDARWVGGTWDLKQFEKDGKTHWDSVIDAGLSLSLSHGTCVVLVLLFFFMLIIESFNNEFM